MMASSYNQVLIDLKALKQNYQILLKKTTRGKRVLVMVKADAYGHGMILVSRTLQEEGCTMFGVAETREAVCLRQAGITGDIFVMLGFDNRHADLFLEFDLTPVIYDSHSLETLSRAALNAGKEVGVHLKIDSGMSRLGFMPDEVEEVVEKIGRLPSLYLAGVMSHFSQSDDLSSAQTLESYEMFTAVKEKAGAHFTGISHIANSGGLLNFPETHSDMVRPGIALYGYYPGGQPGNARESENNLTPVMSFTTKVLQVKDIPGGIGVSYGHTFVTERKTRLAVLPVGYEDGYSRSLSNRGEVLIKGCRAPILGRVCMNLCMVDITDIEGVQAGDEVVLLGVQGRDTITADEIAEWAGTISYEILCMVGNNNERSFIK